MKADGHTARDIAKYLGVSRATLYRRSGLAPGGGSDDSAIAPTGGNDQGASPGGGISALLSPPRGQQHSLVPTRQWVK